MMNTLTSGTGPIKTLMAKMLKDTNAPWLEYADDYQSDCAFLYFWFKNLDPTSSEGGDFFKAGIDTSPEYQGAWTLRGPHGIQRDENGYFAKTTRYAGDLNHLNWMEQQFNFWSDKKWHWIKFWDAAIIMEGSDHMDKDLEANIEFLQTILEDPIKSKFIAFADPWIDTNDTKALDEFRKQHYSAFKAAWITEVRKGAPTDEDIFGNIWNLDASPDPVDDIKEDEPEDQEDGEIIPIEDRLHFGGSTAWVSEVSGNIKLSKNRPGEDWMLIESVNTGHTGDDGEILFVPSVLEGVEDWWKGLGNSDSDIKRVSKTKIIISGAGVFSKSWLRRYFFVKDKDGDLVISY